MLPAAMLRSEEKIMTSQNIPEFWSNIQPALAFTVVKTGIFMLSASYLFGSKNYAGTATFGLSSNLFGIIGNQATRYLEKKINIKETDDNAKKFTKIVFSNIFPLLASLKVCSQMGYKTSFVSLAAISAAGGTALVGICAAVDVLDGKLDVKFNF